MDQRTDTLPSGRFGGQWAFLSNPPPPTISHDQARSLPPSSSYIRSDRSSVSPLPTGLHLQHLNASRSSLPRNIYTPSVGGQSSATIPSQPVLIRINSADASHHLRPTPRPPRIRPKVMDKTNNKLPSIKEYSFEGILNAVAEDVEEDIQAIGELLGRTRFALADQHDSHLPPTGEIRATPLQAVAEASSSTERLMADNVLIVNDEASLVEGTSEVSFAYGLLESLQALPRNRRMNSELPTVSTRPAALSATRNYSSPAVMTESPLLPDPDPILPHTHRSSRDLLYRDATGENEVAQFRTTTAVVSEVYLSAGADGRMISDPPVVSESGRLFPLYSYDESHVFEGNNNNRGSNLSFRERMRRLLLLQDFPGMNPWTARPQRAAARVTPSTSSAESQLRTILGRQVVTAPTHDIFRPHGGQEQDMYQ